MFGKKKNKYYGRDEDRDLADDGLEVDANAHDRENRPRHPIRALNLGNQTYSRNGIIGMHHDTLTNKLTSLKPMKSSKSKNIKLTLDMKEPKYDGINMKTIKVPKAEMKEPKRFSNSFSFDYVEDHLNRMLKKRKR
jgi:hypothetical protein